MDTVHTEAITSIVTLVGAVLYTCITIFPYLPKKIKERALREDKKDAAINKEFGITAGVLAAIGLILLVYESYLFANGFYFASIVVYIIKFKRRKIPMTRKEVVELAFCVVMIFFLSLENTIHEIIGLQGEMSMNMGHLSENLRKVVDNEGKVIDHEEKIIQKLKELDEKNGEKSSLHSF